MQQGCTFDLIGDLPHHHWIKKKKESGNIRYYIIHTIFKKFAESSKLLIGVMVLRLSECSATMWGIVLLKSLEKKILQAQNLDINAKYSEVFNVVMGAKQ